MTSKPTTDQLDSHERYWTTLKEKIDQEASKGDQNELLDTISSVIYAPGTRFHHPLLLDYEIHGFWYTISAAAKSFTECNPQQDTLVSRILYVREIGIVTDKIEGEDTEVILRTSNGQGIWSDLPYLLSDLESACTDTSMSPTETLNLHSFIARLASVGVCGNLLTGCALRLFRDALETQRTSLIKSLLPAIRIWVFYASHKLGAVIKSRFGEGNELSAELTAVSELCRDAGVKANGFSTARWAFWEKRLEVMKMSDEEEISVEAASILNMMAMIADNKKHVW